LLCVEGREQLPGQSFHLGTVLVRVRGTGSLDEHDFSSNAGTLPERTMQ